MNKTQAGWAAGVAGLLVVAALGCAQETPEATESAAVTPAAAATPADQAAASAAPVAANAPADAKVQQKPVVNPGATLPKGKVEATSTAPNGSDKLVFLDEGEKGDWFYRTLYLTSGAHNMELGRYTEIDKIQWGAEGAELTAEVKSPTDSNKLTTYLLRYRLGAETYELKELKVETVESAG